MTLTWCKNKLLSHLSYEEAKELVESIDEDVRHQLEYDEFRLSEESILEKEDVGTLSSTYDFKESALLSDDNDNNHHCYRHHCRYHHYERKGES
jgi:hypothetical protein